MRARFGGTQKGFWIGRNDTPPSPPLFLFVRLKRTGSCLRCLVLKPSRQHGGSTWKLAPAGENEWWKVNIALFLPRTTNYCSVVRLCVIISASLWCERTLEMCSCRSVQLNPASRIRSSRTPCYLEQNRISLVFALVLPVIYYGLSWTRLSRTPRYCIWNRFSIPLRVSAVRFYIMMTIQCENTQRIFALLAFLLLILLHL